MEIEKNITCPNCMKFVDATPVLWTDNFTIRGEEIEVKSMVLQCNECKETFNNKKYPADAVSLAFDVYRKKHNMLMPADFKKMRESVNLSQSEMTQKLGWEKKRLYWLEGGALQTPEDEREFRAFFNQVS